MVKKRLGDLLREEVQKPLNQDKIAATDANTEAVPLTPSANPQADQASSDLASSISNPSEVPNSAIFEEEANPQPVDKPHVRRNHPTKADLEAKVAELQIELTAAHDREQTWQQEIAGLQAETGHQQTQIARLQAELQQIDALKTELTQARADLGQLEQVQAELDQAKAELQKAEQVQVELDQAKMDLQKTEQLKTEVEQLKGAIRNLSQDNNELTNLVKQLKSRQGVEADRQSVHPLYPAVPTRPQVAPARPSGRLSNSDIGWVD